MAVLVIAEHDNAALKPATLNAVAAAQKIGGDVHVLVAGQGARPWPTRRRRSPASPRCCSPTMPLMAMASPRTGAAARQARGRLQPRAGRRDDVRQEPDAARRGAARRDADLRDHMRSSPPTRSCGRSMPATRWRPCSRRTRSRSSPCAAPPSRRPRRPAARRHRGRERRQRCRPVRIRAPGIVEDRSGRS